MIKLSGRLDFADVATIPAELKALAAQASRMFDQAIPLDRIAAASLVLAGENDALAIRPENLARAIPRGRCAMVPGDHLGAVRQAQLIGSALEFLDR